MTRDEQDDESISGQRAESGIKRNKADKDQAEVDERPKFTCRRSALLNLQSETNEEVLTIDKGEGFLDSSHPRRPTDRKS